MSAGVRRERLFAEMDGSFVVFLVGMRINSPWKVHKWWPVAQAMPRMLEELRRQPDLGLLGGEMWGGRTTILLQYWRSADHLFAYAKNRQARHLPAWSEFNRAICAGGAVGIWHESYVVSPGGYENIYVNMPPFGLGRAGTLHSASGALQGAEARLRASGSLS